MEVVRVRFLFLLLSYGVFLLFGATVLWAVESPSERLLRDSLRSLRARLLQQHRSCLSAAQLDALLEQLLPPNALSSAAHGGKGQSWGVSSALFFVVSVLTTTGYGHTMPLSEWGKVICVVYSFFGIPLTLMLLSCLLRFLLPLVTFRPIQYIHRRWGFSVDGVALLHAALLGLVTVGLFILTPAICFWALEGNWSFLESVYFCFISLSTIGLGDHIPEGSLHPHLHELYKVSITCYLLVGLLAVVITLETVYHLREIQALIQFITPRKDHPSEDHDRLEILPRDESAFSTESGGTLREEPTEQPAT